MGRLDRRTVGICMCIALIAALAAGALVVMLGDTEGGSSAGGSPDGISLTPASRADAAKALRTPIRTLDGRATTLGFRVGHGAPTVVNFFSKTCVPCVTEMPALERVHRSRDDVRFVGVDVLDSAAAARALIARTGITYEPLWDRPEDLLRAVGGVGLPTTLLIDGDGRIVAFHTGALTESALRSLIRRSFG